MTARPAAAMLLPSPARHEPIRNARVGELGNNEVRTGGFCNPIEDKGGKIKTGQRCSLRTAHVTQNQVSSAIPGSMKEEFTAIGITAPHPLIPLRSQLAGYIGKEPSVDCMQATESNIDATAADRSEIAQRIKLRRLLSIYRFSSCS